MSDTTNVFDRLTNLDVAPLFQPYSKVIIHVSDDRVIERGDDTGRTLEFDNPFGTQAMARNILNSLRGIQYQPYYANGALLDPAAEIGDGVNMHGNYGGIYTRSRTFGRLMKADISAPHDEEINHEYAFEAPETRQFTRQVNDLKASLVIANGRIDATVTKTGGDNSTFGWTLTATAHTWYANGQRVMRVNQYGLAVTGEITALSGKIGKFNIGDIAIWNNISDFANSGNKRSGVYLGTDGIRLGRNFTVDNSGNIIANNAKLTGTLTIGGETITAADLQYGAASANAWATDGTATKWSVGSGYGINYNDAQARNSRYRPEWFSAYNLQAQSKFFIGNTEVEWCRRTVKNAAGVDITIQYLGINS